MKITPHGAAGGEVTGSAYFVQTDRANVLVDFGLFQGMPKAEEKNRLPQTAAFRQLDAVLLTHAHLDHTGRLPLLVKNGFSQPVFCTPATIELTTLILRDGAKIQAQDLERTNRRRERAGRPPLEPLYLPEDVEELLGLFRAVPYGPPVAVAPGIEARWLEAGHMLGSASIQLTVQDRGVTKRVVFSGDLGPLGAPILKDAEPFQTADAVFLESTYGDRDHKPFQETIDEFLAIVREAIKRRGKILVPTFAVGRAQLLMTLLAWAFRRKKLPPFPVYLDSPMAIDATKIYERHPELWDEEMTTFVKERRLRDDLERAGAKASVSAEDSKALNDMPGPCMILAGAGMCNAGRILHHLRKNLWKPETSVLIVGYQGQGTLGRRLVDGAPEVKIFGEPVSVKARVHTLGGFSAHAGQSDLLRWFSAMAGSHPRVLLTHGEDRGREPLAKLIQQQFKLAAELPRYRQTIEI